MNGKERVWLFEKNDYSKVKVLMLISRSLFGKVKFQI